MDVLNDDALGLILDQVDSHVSLIRAAAVCSRWRRAIADAAFLRRYRSLHAPAVAFEFDESCNLNEGPVLVRSPPSMVDARHLSLDFLPGGAASWVVMDSRGSLLLLRRANLMPEKVVCEPLTRRYRMIPPPAGFDGSYCWGYYLIDGEADDAGSRISMTNFRVLCSFHTHGAMYTVGSSWSKKIDHVLPSFELLRPMGRGGGGCWYFVQGMALVVLDCSTGDYSSFQLPPLVENWDYHAYNFFITRGQDGKLCIFTVFDGTMKQFARLEGGEWALEKRVLLSEATRGLPGYMPSFFSEPQYVLRVGTGYVTLTPIDEQWIFSINLETMEAAPAVEPTTWMVYGCELPWPPTFHACLDG